MVIEANKTSSGVEYLYHSDTSNLSSDLTVIYHPKSQKDVDEVVEMFEQIINEIKNWKYEG